MDLYIPLNVTYLEQLFNGVLEYITELEVQVPPHCKMTDVPVLIPFTISITSVCVMLVHWYKARNAHTVAMELVDELKKSTNINVTLLKILNGHEYLEPNIDTPNVELN